MKNLKNSKIQKFFNYKIKKKNIYKPEIINENDWMKNIQKQANKQKQKTHWLKSIETNCGKLKTK